MARGRGDTLLVVWGTALNGETVVVGGGSAVVGWFDVVGGDGVLCFSLGSRVRGNDVRRRGNDGWLAGMT